MTITNMDFWQVNLDFAKVFDCVNHDLIVSKLENKFGIYGLLLQILRDYLCTRYQEVVINGFFSGTLSGTLSVLSGDL